MAYNLGLDKEVLKLASGFGGGVAIEDKCGALTDSIMVLEKSFTPFTLYSCGCMCNYE